MAALRSIKSEATLCYARVPSLLSSPVVKLAPNSSNPTNSAANLRNGDGRPGGRAGGIPRRVSPSEIQYLRAEPVDSLRDTSLISEQPHNLLLQ